MGNKTNCYNCTYRRSVPGDAHSSCAYPGTNTNILEALFDSDNADLVKKLNITADEHGVRSGWFF